MLEVPQAADGTVYIADAGSGTISKASKGVITTVAGFTDYVYDLRLDAAGNLYIAAGSYDRSHNGSMRLGRNDPCHCGSGKKYKKCCLAAEESGPVVDDPLQAAERRAYFLPATGIPAGRLSHLGVLPTGSLLRMWAPADEEAADGVGTLGELLDWLAREHRPGFMYRGQVKHYPGLLPSGFRGAMAPGAGDRAVIALEPERYRAAMTELETRRYAALAQMIREYGISLGNILAQQYGLSSEAIDVTSDLQVAGFFATRRYPEYRQWKGRPGDVGVIYRFPYDTETWGDPANLDTFLTCVGTEVPEHGPVYFTHYRKAWDLPGELQERIREQFFTEHGERRVSLFSPYIVVDEEFVRNGVRGVDFAATRVGRQHGGFLCPPVHRVCRVAGRVRVRRTPGFKTFDPPVAIGEELQGVGNSLMLPDMEAFYFRHGDYRVPLEPEYLWPSAKEDPLYARIEEMLGEGVVDRGYLPA
ncbi:MAG: repeat containing protein [Candidatus Solibacter sp.]|nr:repeat containing protein [Candidatus Solibacter sp.]